MFWWLIILTVLVLYLLWCCMQVSQKVTYLTNKLEESITWQQTFYNAVIEQFQRCGCPSEEGWPPPKPPNWP